MGFINFINENTTWTFTFNVEKRQKIMLHFCKRNNIYNNMYRLEKRYRDHYAVSSSCLFKNVTKKRENIGKSNTSTNTFY